MSRVPNPADIVVHPKTWELGQAPWRQRPLRAEPHRVIVDNDFASDPDDLPQLVHHLLSPTCEIPLVVASHLPPADWQYPGENSADASTLVARDVFARMGLTSTGVIVTGAQVALTDATTPQDSPAARAIIAEALRDDPRPLYYAAGGGLTDLASALLLEPAIGEKITLIWIGGHPHEGIGKPMTLPPHVKEYNLSIDPLAASVCFADPNLTIWQCPFNAYTSFQTSDAEMLEKMARTGPLGQHLYDEINHIQERWAAEIAPIGEAYCLGDNPLVLLTALRGTYGMEAGSSSFVSLPKPLLNPDTTYTPRPEAKPMRVYHHLDARLGLEDFFAKLAAFARWQEQP
ncbi:MAG: nucleoside hydrolase [Promicromonosporaceae bacterium]|nr:nucleoside hydrolase [Promicromonosporaceae bacterium]